MAWAMETATIGYPCNIGKHTDWATAPALSLPCIVFWPGSGQSSLVDGLTRDSPTPVTMANVDTLVRDSDGADFACVVIGPWASGSWSPKKVRVVVDAIIAQASTWKIDITKIFHCGLSLGSIALSNCIMQVPGVGNYRDAKGYFIAAGGANTFAIWPDSLNRGMNAWDVGTLIKGIYGENDTSGNWVTTQMDAAADYANGVNEAIVTIPKTAVDQITNGDFTTDLTGWTTKAGDSGTWAVVSSKASITTVSAADNSDILIQNALTELTQYDVKFYYTESAADIIGYVVSLDSSDNIVNSVVIPGGNTTSNNYTNTKKHIMLNSGAGGVKLGFYFLTGAAGATMTIDLVICRTPGKYRLWEAAGYVHSPSWNTFLGNTADDDDFNGWGMYNQICDVVAPTIPTGMITTNLKRNSFTVSWSPSTDATTFVYKYEVYLDAVLVYTITSEIPYHPALTYDFKNLVPNTPYVVTIKSVDFMGNVSAASSNHNVTTIASPAFP